MRNPEPAIATLVLLPLIACGGSATGPSSGGEGDANLAGNYELRLQPSQVCAGSGFPQSLIDNCCLLNAVITQSGSDLAVNMTDSGGNNLVSLNLTSGSVVRSQVTLSFLVNFRDGVGAEYAHSLSAQAQTSTSEMRGSMAGSWSLVGTPTASCNATNHSFRLTKR